jgi:hypothetical protein
MCNTARSARGTDVMLWKLGGPFDVKPLNDVLVILGAGYGERLADLAGSGPMPESHRFRATFVS